MKSQRRAPARLTLCGRYACVRSSASTTAAACLSVLVISTICRHADAAAAASASVEAAGDRVSQILAGQQVGIPVTTYCVVAHATHAPPDCTLILLSISIRILAALRCLQSAPAAEHAARQRHSAVVAAGEGFPPANSIGQQSARGSCQITDISVLRRWQVHCWRELLHLRTGLQAGEPALLVRAAALHPLCRLPTSLPPLTMMHSHGIRPRAPRAPAPPSSQR